MAGIKSRLNHLHLSGVQIVITARDAHFALAWPSRKRLSAASGFIRVLGVSSAFT